MPFGWGAIFGLLNLPLGGAILNAWVKLRPKMRELEENAEEKLRDDLIARVEKLEKKLDEERVSHEAEMTVMRPPRTRSPRQSSTSRKCGCGRKAKRRSKRGAIVAAKIAVATPPVAG